MTAPTWAAPLLAWRQPGTVKAQAKVTRVLGDEWAPNIADSHNTSSLRIAARVYGLLGITSRLSAVIDDQSADADSGAVFERAIRADVKAVLTASAPQRIWTVGSEDIADFEQFRHLGDLRGLLAEQPVLRDILGTDYAIKPDVTVGEAVGDRKRLHAVVSCKWTLRSDRAQNVRPEFGVLIRSRRGRAPHLVAVTLEPLPSRLASLTRGTGEIDAVYHVLFDEMNVAVADHGTAEQKEHWQEMTAQSRLKSYAQLLEDLAA